MCFRHFDNNESIPSGISLEGRPFVKQVIMVKYDSISAKNIINLSLGFDCIGGHLNFSYSNIFVILEGQFRILVIRDTSRRELAYGCSFDFY